MYSLNSSIKQFLLFIVVGMLNTLFGYLVFCLFVFLKMHYAVASLLATIIGVIFNFRTTGQIVFKNAQSRLFVRFALVYTMLYLVNVASIKGYSLILSNIYLCGGMSACSTALLAFLLNKYLVFRVPSDSEGMGQVYR